MFTHVLGFPRIGRKRELKRAIESYWKGNISQEELLNDINLLKHERWQTQKAHGLDLVTAGDFSLYDHVLDTSVMLGAIPGRYNISQQVFKKGGGLDEYFLMARGGYGDAGISAMAMTKWFDTNYHYIVPELSPDTQFNGMADRLIMELEQAADAGCNPKVVILGPLSYLYLSRIGPEVDDDFDILTLVDRLVPAYQAILKDIDGRVEWIQIDEPILVLDLPERFSSLFKDVYENICGVLKSSRTILATYFGDLGENLDTALSLPVSFLHLDLVRAPLQLDRILRQLPEHMGLSLGVIDGRNVWCSDLEKILNTVSRVESAIGLDRLALAPSCSLLHVPVDLGSEDSIPQDVRPWLAFAVQKLDELQVLKSRIMGEDVEEELLRNKKVNESRRMSVDREVRDRIAAVDDDMFFRKKGYDERRVLQNRALNLPLLPTTTIGSFPQDDTVRGLRRDLSRGIISQEQYRAGIQDVIRKIIEVQEEIDLDVLVHGEPERTDMVEYFADRLSGFLATENGWVQSYGTRCVRPPIIYGDVSRPEPMTVDWISYAQSLTNRPVKGMLTGPVTMLNWSFVRDDLPRAEVCKQIALAIRDEVEDLEASGIKVIQIDEPALREGMPLRSGETEQYLKWAVESFRLASSSVADSTQIHTHMCYSFFNDIMPWIARMDADVISIEASRSKMKLLTAFKDFDYPNEIGPGVYDIHSPRVPSVEEMIHLIDMAAQVIPVVRLWVNPDCGLKTRNWSEVIPSLKNMVSAARSVRDRYKNYT